MLLPTAPYGQFSLITKTKIQLLIKKGKKHIPHTHAVGYHNIPHTHALGYHTFISYIRKINLSKTSYFSQ